VATATPPPSGLVSGTHAGWIASIGATDSYTFSAASSGWVVIESCVANAHDGNTYNLYVYDSDGNVLGSGTTASRCKRVRTPVMAGQTYTVTTVSVAGTGAYLSVWRIGRAPPGP
jgi:hypothetical protein